MSAPRDESAAADSAEALLDGEPTRDSWTGWAACPTDAAANPSGWTARATWESILRVTVCGAIAVAGWSLDALPAAAQGSAAPRTFAVSADARPIDVGSTSQTTSAMTSAPLRWRSKSSGAVATQTIADRGEVAQVGLTLNAPVETDGAIRQPSPTASGTRNDRLQSVVQAANNDPFNDPFGDRAANRGPQLAQRNATANDSMPNEVGPRLLGLPETQMTQEDRFGPSGNRAPFDAPNVPAPTDPGMETAPLDSYQSPANRACRRVYNERDCCDVDGTCRAFVASLLADGIADVSLDITPRYMPDLDLQEEGNMRVDKLRFSDKREWRDRNGQLLATGRLGNLSNGRAVIVDDSGAEVAQVPLHQLGDDEQCFVAGWWRLPAECALYDNRGVNRNWMPSSFAWHASALCHKPLYFEEVQLERYGHTTGSFVQPFVSGAHFFGSVALLPYQMAIHPPTECQYVLGYYRPGSCAPWHIPPVPFSVRGAMAETGFVLGGIYILP